MNIVNKKTFQGKGVYVGRPSALGNPYSHLPTGTLAQCKVATRDEAVERYGHWLLRKIRSNDVAVMRMLESLSEDSTLICWCAPERCHAEMIERAWNWLKDLGEL